MQNALEIGALCQQEEDVKSQIVDLDIVQQILNTPPWTTRDLLMTEGYSRMLHLKLELSRHDLLGRDGFSRQLGSRT